VEFQNETQHINLVRLSPILSAQTLPVECCGHKSLKSLSNFAVINHNQNTSVNAGNRLSYLSIYCVASSNVYTYNSNVYLTNSKNIMNKSYANTCDFSRGLTSSSSDELPVYDARYTYKTNEHNTCIWMLKTDSIICGLLVVANWINMLKSEIHTSVGLHITET